MEINIFKDFRSIQVNFEQKTKVLKHIYCKSNQKQANCLMKFFTSNSGK